MLKVTEITYEQGYQEYLDITFIMKYTTYDDGTEDIEVSGFYYGKANDEDFKIYKDSGVTTTTK